MRCPIGNHVAIIACVFAFCATTGCVRRTISITSDPTGALVHLNGREVGRTPLDIEFVHYGTYDVVLEKEGYEPLLTDGRADAPIWDNVPLDFCSEMIPADLQSKVVWHYTLEPRNDDPALLLDRARALRQRLEAAPLPEPQPATTGPATQP